MSTDPVGITGGVSSEVGVVGLGVNATVVDDELESVLHLPAVAAAVLGVAVNDLLLRQRHEVACHDLVDPLDGCHCRERPASTCNTCMPDDGRPAAPAQR